MSNRMLFWITGLGVACMAILLILNSLPFIWMPKTEKYLKYNDVRGMAVQHKDKLYTLNFDQQTKVVGYLNQAIPLKDNAQAKPSTLEVSKIIIYRFDRPDLILVPIEYKNNNLIFSSPDWNREGLMRDTSGGELKTLLESTYDT